ncbi:MAG: mannose-1-phosphate guanylyltransferase/mannose-6-phosphate isomerase [Candidatus Omnitrophica bacterium]|nr:mannose-1-phosphate guanylyltransferase/mannose-6-phosphate isomerase [Candidatus Omnitrophota bacterium]
MHPKKISKDRVYVLILAGGVGSRFWPFSRELEPKQFMQLVGKETLLQDTISRLKGFVKMDHVYIMTNRSYFYEIKKQVNKFSLPEENIILEPEGRNTAPAIGYFAGFILKKDKDAVFVTLPSDHYIKDKNEFKKTLERSLVPAGAGFLVTIGIKPRKPSTGYGYIKIRGSKITGTYFLVEKFLEKPNIKKAARYVASKDYFWNSGMFIWRADIFLRELRKYQPGLEARLSGIHVKEDLARIWPGLTSISVDYAIMEHSKGIALVPALFDWTDLGSWDALEEVLPKDKQKNIIQADSLNYNCKGISVYSRAGRLICALGLNDLIIADTPDALLVCHKDRAQDVKQVVDSLKKGKRKEHISHTTEKRPWGSYTVLQMGEGFKIKIVEIDPKKRLSLQRHAKRAEHWVVVCGTAKVTCGSQVKLVHSNESIYIPKFTKHRLENPGDNQLKIVEVQTGAYLEEDDIQRFEDDFIR